MGKNISLKILGFALLGSLLVPLLLSDIQFTYVPMTGEEAFKLAVPFLISIPIISIYLHTKTSKKKKLPLHLAMLLGILFMTQGQSMNSVANYFSNHFQAELTSSDVYFYDELLGHVLWSTGYLITLFVFTYLSRFEVSTKMKNKAIFYTSIALVGIVNFLGSVESQTVFLHIPGMLIIVAVTLHSAVNEEETLDGMQLRQLLLFSSTISLFLLFVYGIVYSGFPELSLLGLI